MYVCIYIYIIYIFIRGMIVVIWLPPLLTIVYLKLVISLQLGCCVLYHIFLPAYNHAITFFILI